MSVSVVSELRASVSSVLKVKGQLISGLRMTSTIPYALTQKRPQLRTRKASATDFHDVIKIEPSGGVVKGVTRGDYLRQLFPRCLDQSKFLAHVHYVNREFAGFTAVQMVDAGETAVWRTARIRSKFAEPGIFGDVMRSVMTKLIEGQPRLKNHVFASTSEMGKLVWSVPVFKDHGTSEITRRNLVTRYCHTKDIRTPDNRSCAVRELTQYDVINLSYNSRVYETFFPDGQVFAHRMPLKLMEENLYEVVDNISASVFVSVNGQNSGVDNKSPLLKNRNLTNNQISKIDTISTAFYNHTEHGLLYEVDILHGSSIDTVTAHINHHLLRMRELAEGGEGELRLTCGKGAELESVTRCLDDAGLGEQPADADNEIVFYRMEDIEEFRHSGDNYDSLCSHWEKSWGRNGGADRHDFKPQTVITRPVSMHV